MQHLNAAIPISVNCDCSSKCTVAKDVQSRKAFSPIMVTDEGIIIDFRDLQYPNAHRSMTVTVDGMIIDFKREHCLKAYLGIVVRDASIVASVMSLGTTSPSKVYMMKCLNFYMF
mmetsp:Transcript_19715/g.24322  ORF Transcript_19715/g.24322 Transcript_19715/m.24322 type:complete len:115 (+) Transcript_19715:1117-1461(+)